MHSQAIPRPEDGRNQEHLQRALLAFILAEHPAQLTADELRREVGDGVEQAIDDLSRAGLLRREGASILPTRAALHFDRLPT